MKYVKGKPIIDTVNVSLGDMSSIKGQLKDIKDAEQNRILDIEIDATHGGYINKNFYYYTPDAQARAAVSFFAPFKKPMLLFHEDNRDAVGRIYDAVWIPMSTMVDKADDTTVPKCKIRIKALITDPKAIDKVIDQRYLTVSVGSVPKTPPICSICGKQVNDDECTHYRGQTYDGQVCYWKIVDLEYQECSFENRPADSSESHFAGVTSVRLIESSTMKDVLDAPMASQDKSTVADGEEDPEVRTFVQKLYSVVADVSDYPAGITEEWKVEDEIKEAEKMDAGYTQLASVLFGDKEISTEARAKMDKAVFCGPNSMFPVIDSKNVAAAIMYLNLPATKKDYSSASRARIFESVTKKAKALGCEVGKKDGEEFKTKIADLESQLTALNAQIAQVQKDKEVVLTEKQEMTAQLAAATQQATDRHVQLKRQIAERYVDLQLAVKSENVKDVSQATTNDVRDTTYNAHVEQYLAQSQETIEAGIADIKKKVLGELSVLDRIGDPNAKDETKQAAVKDCAPRTQLGKRVFGA